MPEIHQPEVDGDLLVLVLPHDLPLVIPPPSMWMVPGRGREGKCRSPDGSNDAFLPRDDSNDAFLSRGGGGQRPPRTFPPKRTSAAG
ncbi:hypothetical protein Acsp07_25680 [Actinomycetospora sp. NBRC 106378]|nr:hypothetical protein Acsp07_25680 [Actinomycetospora sp. NBRC 106378]